MQNFRTLIIPDVHGRDFWREPVVETLKSTNAHICFLGDFLSPYSNEFEKGVDYNRKAIDVFKEIIGLKLENPKRITLLLGNHDLSYRFSIVAYFNNAYFTEEARVINSLGMYDLYRGWVGYDYGSLVWADIHSWFPRQEYDGYGDYQIVGHTQLVHGCGGLIDEKIADLHSAEAFVLTEEGEIKQFSKIV